VLTDRGFAKVGPTLQLEGHPNIFALGDIIDWPEAKQLTKISLGHTPVVIANVLSYLEGKAPKKVYTKSTEILSISNGKVRVRSRFPLPPTKHRVTTVGWWCIIFGTFMGSYFRQLLHEVLQIGRPDGCTSKKKYRPQLVVTR